MGSARTARPRGTQAKADPLDAAVLNAFGVATLSRGQAATLAGLALPTSATASASRRTGQFTGKRQISGGRSQARQGLSMATLTASRSHPSLKALYARLLAAGKPPQVALFAVLRKLLILLNHVLKNPGFSLEP